MGGHEMDGSRTIALVTFGALRFDTRLGELSRRGGDGVWTPVTMGSRTAAILGALLREPGALVSRDAIMDEVWPNTTVELNNLTVQMAALRRALDAGGSGESLIQTVPGRGYRFAGTVDRPAPGGFAPPFPATPLPPIVPARWQRGPMLWIAAAALACFFLVVIVRLDRGPAQSPPRMSLVVLPFQNLSGDPKDDSLAASVTDDLVNRLSRYQAVPAAVRPASVGASKLTPGEIGRSYRTRYVLRGSVRRLGDSLQVNAQLLATETGRALWTDQLGESLGHGDAGQREIVRRIAEAAGSQMVVTEDERSRRERPNDPDALDLVLRVGAIGLLPPSGARLTEARDLYEEALRRDPSMSTGRFSLVNLLLDGEDGVSRGRKTVLEQARELIVTIRSTEPASWATMLANLHWLSWQSDHCMQTIDLAEQIISLYPEFAQAYRWLGDCQTRVGLAQEALPALFKAADLDAGRGWEAHDERNLQYAFLLLGRYDESIARGLRALVDNPEDTIVERGRMEFRLAAAYALADRLDEAKRHLAAGLRLSPWTTLRQFETGQQASPVYGAQLGRVIDGLRLAGLVDHADEFADFGVPADDLIHGDSAGGTPTTVPGAKTIDTDQLSALLATEKPIVIDTLLFFAGRSIPGAVGFRFAGAGGSLTDVAQDHLRTIMRELVHGDPAKPLVAMGWNSQNFEGRNLALRLAALGYTNVFWYRGGREAWEAQQRPEAALTAMDW